MTLSASSCEPLLTWVVTLIAVDLFVEAGAYAWSRASKQHGKHRHRFRRQPVAVKGCSACVGGCVG